MGIGQAVRFGGWLRARPLAFTITVGALGVLIIVVAILGVRSSAADASALQRLRAGEGITVTGTLEGSELVVRERAPNLPDKVSYCPRYAYATADGVQRTLADYDNCASSETRITDQTVRILLDPEHPDTAFIDEPQTSVGRSSSAIFSWAILTLGVALVVMAIVRMARGHGKRSATRSGDSSPDEKDFRPPAHERLR